MNKYLTFTYRLFMMAVYFYCMIPTGFVYKCTDYYTPFGWACSGFEWHWEML